MLAAEGIRCDGCDPTAELSYSARQRDPQRDYRIEPGEALSLPGRQCGPGRRLSLIDIPTCAALAQAHRVLKPAGTFLIAYLQSFNSAAVPQAWTHEPDGTRRFCIGHYLQERVAPLGAASRCRTGTVSDAGLPAKTAGRRL